jgi:hypothetical protein
MLAEDVMFSTTQELEEDAIDAVRRPSRQRLAKCNTMAPRHEVLLNVHECPSTGLSFHQPEFRRLHIAAILPLRDLHDFLHLSRKQSQAPQSARQFRKGSSARESLPVTVTTEDDVKLTESLYSLHIGEMEAAVNCGYFKCKSQVSWDSTGYNERQSRSLAHAPQGQYAAPPVQEAR